MVDQKLLIYQCKGDEDNQVYIDSNSSVSRNDRVYSENWYKTIYESSK